jgi:hypothetical protein
MSGGDFDKTIKSILHGIGAIRFMKSRAPGMGLYAEYNVNASNGKLTLRLIISTS